MSINVLSLFDGISCCRVALERAKIKVNKYYAAEIDKYAMKIAMKNYSNTLQLGSVIDFKNWNIDWSKINLVTGGFPCQSWSIAGKQLGDKDERGMLFWTMLDIMKKVLDHNPKAKFLIENVKMKKEFEEYITFHTKQVLGGGGVNKILLNSSLVSAQNRQRFYWTNIDGIELPEDKGILLRDILEDGLNDVARIVNRRLNQEGKREDYNFNIPLTEQIELRKDNKSGCLTTVQKDNVVLLRPCKIREYKQDSICHHVADAIDIKGNESIKRVYADSGKAPTLTTMGGGHREPKVLVHKICNVNPSGKGMNGNVYGITGKSPTLTTNKGEGMKILIVPEATKQGYVEIYPNEGVDLTFINSKTRRGRAMRTKSNCLTATTYDYNFWNGYSYRKLTPIECERLQTLPDNYTEGVSNSQRYKMLGNCWTVDIISWIFKNLNFI